MKLLLYLVEDSFITEQDLLQLVRLREAHRIPIGRLALEAKLLVIPQIFNILSESSLSGERFGEACLRLGVLSQSQIWMLLGKQEDRLPSFTSLLTEHGYISEEQLRAYLPRYHAKFVA